MTVRSALAAVLTCGVIASSATADAGILALPPSSGFATSSAFSISADGTTVVGAMARGPALDPDTIHAARWVIGSPAQDLGFIPDATFGTRARRISANGQVVIGRADGQSNSYFRWAGSGPLVPLPVPAQTTSIMANDVSPDGSFTVGTRVGEGAGRAVRWQGFALPQPLALPAGATSTAAWCVEPGGDVIGSAAIGGVQQLVRWTGDVPQTLGPVPANLGLAVFGAAADAQALVGSVINSPPQLEQAFRWTPSGGFEVLARPAGTATAAALGVSADGTVAVGISYPASALEPWVATVWVGATPLRLADYLSSSGVDVTGWSFEQATGISADGTRIVGSGVNPQGVYTAFVATVPAPGAGACIAAGLGLIARRRRR